MTYDSTSTGDDQIRSSAPSGTTKSNNGNLGIDIVESNSLKNDSSPNLYNKDQINDHENELNNTIGATTHSLKTTPSPPLPNINNNVIFDEHHTAATSSPSVSNGENDAICYNQVLDNEIRSRLDKLNALSDLINSLERQFDEANSVFRETLKCSTDRLSSIAKALGHKSIRHARVYHAARLSVEQTQSDCQKACVQFEQANKDHQFAKKAIRDAELKLKEVAGKAANGAISIPDVDVDSICVNVHGLKLIGNSRAEEDGHSSNDHQLEECSQKSSCDTETNSLIPTPTLGFNIQDGTTINANADQVSTSSADFTDSGGSTAQVIDAAESNNRNDEKASLSPSSIITYAAKLSEELNQAIVKLIEAETKRGQSERQHLEHANKLMLAQENLMKLEREYGPSIRRSQLYFDESKRFNAKLDSVKRDICRISEEILATKQAYAQTLSELEQFSDDLHDNS